MKKIENIVKREYLVYEANKYVNDFQQYEIVRYFVNNIFAGKITLDNADKDQGDSLNDFVDFNKRAKPRDVEKTNYWKSEFILWRWGNGS